MLTCKRQVTAMIDFLAKRVTLLAVISALIVFIVRGWDFFIAAGIIFGSSFTIFKITLNCKNLLSMCALGKRRSPLFFIASQTACFAFLLISILIDIRLFAGMTAGLLLMPAVICLNGITEKTGLTRNGWGEA